MALAYEKLGNFDKSIKCYGITLKIYKVIYGVNHPEVTKVCNTLEEICLDLGKKQIKRREASKAIEYYEQALHFVEDGYGKDHSKISTICIELGQILQKSGDAQKAVTYFMKALTIEKKKDEPNHAKKEEILNFLTTSILNLTKFDQVKLPDNFVGTYGQLLSKQREDALLQMTERSIESKNEKLNETIPSVNITVVPATSQEDKTISHRIGNNALIRTQGPVISQHLNAFERFKMDINLLIKKGLRIDVQEEYANAHLIIYLILENKALPTFEEHLELSKWLSILENHIKNLFELKNVTHILKGNNSLDITVKNADHLTQLKEWIKATGLIINPFSQTYSTISKLEDEGKKDHNKEKSCVIS